MLWRVVFFFFLSSVFSTSVHAQNPLLACPDINLGPDTSFICTTSCFQLGASVQEVGETSSYSVDAIPFLPPYAFNQGTPIMVGLDDVFSEAIDLPFNFSKKVS